MVDHEPSGLHDPLICGKVSEMMGGGIITLHLIGTTRWTSQSRSRAGH